MEGRKSYALLFIYNALKEGKVVKMEDIIDKFQINERTFYRYIKDIKEFVEDECGSNNGILGEEVISGIEKGSYILKGEHGKNISEKEVLAISKVLLESRGFIKTEMKDMLFKLLDNCISSDKEKIEFIIGNELINYISPQHGKELLNILWQISCAIKDKKKLEIGYAKLGKDGKIKEHISTRIILPQGLLFSEYYFYLIAQIDGTNYQYPTIYRVDRIKELVIKEEKYKKDYSERFQAGEFRKLIQFMQTGDVENIKFRFTGSSIEAVLDRLPNAKVTNEKQGEYIVEAQLFGKGIKMWLLSQGNSVELLSPENIRGELIETIEKMRILYM